MSARIQTWFPFDIYVCLNGREWLARQMDRAQMTYERVRELLPVDRGIRRKPSVWMDRQLRTSWLTPLRQLSAHSTPLMGGSSGAFPSSITGRCTKASGEPT